MHKTGLLRIVLGCACCALFSAVSIGEPSQPLMMLAQNTPTPTPTQSTQSAQQGPQVWNLKDADIRAVIQTMAILTGKSFIIDPQVQGRVTLVSHKPMSTDEMYQVFLSMLRMLNFSAVPSAGGVIKVIPSQNANIYSRQIATDQNPGQGAEVVVRVLPLNNVSATELVPVIRPLMSETASVTAYMPSNALILAGTASNISRMVALIRQMDESNINQIKIVHLQYANATKVVSVIRSLQNANASQGRVSNVALSADENGNNILISANAANQLLVNHLIQELDQKGSDGDDTVVVKLNYLTAKELAPILSKVAQGISESDAAAGKTTGAASATTGGSANISVQAENTNNAIIIHAPRALMNGLMRVVKRLDIRPQEVLVEAIIVKVNESVLNKLGIVWGAVNSDNSIGGTDSTTDTDGNVTSTPPDNSFQFKINSKGVGFLPTGSLGMILHLLKTNGSSDVLSTPSVVVLNNQKASIDDGQNVGLANRSYQGVAATPTTGNTSATPFNTIERQNVTLSLEVTPHISPNNMIRMELLQKDDSLAASSSSDDPDNPTLNTSSIKTSVLVRSGDILVLGGLISNEQDKQKQKIPVLGDIPVLGHLFQYNTHTIDKKSLMVFIRPIVMDRGNALKQTQHRYRYIRQEQVNMAMNSVVDKGLPMLPKLDRHGPVHLQSPVSGAYLPSPETTVVHTDRAH